MNEINENMSINELDSWDSLSQMDLVITLEKEYSVNFDLHEIRRMNSYNGIVQLLSNKGIDLGA
jgi:acyl carrier protein